MRIQLHVSVGVGCPRGGSKKVVAVLQILCYWLWVEITWMADVPRTESGPPSQQVEVWNASYLSDEISSANISDVSNTSISRPTVLHSLYIAVVFKYWRWYTWKNLHIKCVLADLSARVWVAELPQRPPGLSTRPSTEPRLGTARSCRDQWSGRFL